MVNFQSLSFQRKSYDSVMLETFVLVTPPKQRLLKLRNPVLSDFLNYLTQRVINLSQAHIYE